MDPKNNILESESNATEIKEVATKSVLSQQDSVPMLVFLLKSNGSARSSDLQKVIPDRDSLESIASTLESEGLIEITQYFDESAYTLYTLTPRGQNVAAHLHKAEKVLSGEVVANPDGDVDHDVPSEKKDPKSDDSMDHSASNSIQTSIQAAKPTLVEILIAVHDNPGITMNDLNIKINKGDINNIMQEAIDKQYLFKAITGSPKIAPGYYITVGGTDHIGSLAPSKNDEDAVKMDCDASSK